VQQVTTELPTLAPKESRVLEALPASTKMAFGVDTMSRSDYWQILGILIVLTVLDTVLVAVVFYYYTGTYANFINQANFIYAFVSTGPRYIAYLYGQRALPRTADN
jgi:hypothetical protein